MNNSRISINQPAGLAAGLATDSDAPIAPGIYLECERCKKQKDSITIADISGTGFS